MASDVFAAIQHSRVGLCLLLMKRPSYFLIHRRTCRRCLKEVLPVVCPEAPRLEQPVPQKVFPCRPSMDGLEWRVSEAYFN
jgi:hypothetical protein